MVIVKPDKLYMLYGIFMALHVFISISIFTFKVCWEIPCDEGFNFVETFQPIGEATQASGFYMVWVSTVKNIRADYHFCCFNIKKLCYVIFISGSCTTDFSVLYLDAG